MLAFLLVSKLFNPRVPRLFSDIRRFLLLWAQGAICHLCHERLAVLYLQPCNNCNTNTQIRIHKYEYTNTNTQIRTHKNPNTQIHKYKYTNTNTQIQIHKYTNTQIHKYKYTNTNTNIQSFWGIAGFCVETNKQTVNFFLINQKYAICQFNDNTSVVQLQRMMIGLLSQFVLGLMIGADCE